MSKCKNEKHNKRFILGNFRCPRCEPEVFKSALELEKKAMETLEVEMQKLERTRQLAKKKYCGCDMIEFGAMCRNRSEKQLNELFDLYVTLKSKGSNL